MPFTRTQPRKMSLTACISRCPTTTRCPPLSYSLAPDELPPAPTGRPPSPAGTAGCARRREQQHPGAGAHAAHADDLPGEVDEPVLVEQHPPLGLEGGRGRRRASPAARLHPLASVGPVPRGPGSGTISGGSATIAAAAVLAHRRTDPAPRGCPWSGPWRGCARASCAAVRLSRRLASGPRSAPCRRGRTRPPARSIPANSRIAPR